MNIWQTKKWSEWPVEGRNICHKELVLQPSSPFARIWLSLLFEFHLSSPFFDVCAMTLAMPDPSSAKHRTLPKPSAIRQNLTDGTSTSKDSSPWQHRLVSHKLSQDLPESDLGRRSTVPSIAYYERRPSNINGGQTPMVDSISNVPASLPSIALGPLIQKQDASAMADESRPGTKSPSGPVASEGPREFCLCQPDPKIPRPRNGK